MNKKEKEVQQVFLNNEKAVLKKLEGNYKVAIAEINNKIDILMARQDANMQHVIYQVEYQKALKTQVQAILETLQTNEFETISEYLAKSYQDGFVGTMYNIQGQGIPLVFPIDQEQVVAAIQHETKLSESLYTALGKDVADLKKKIASEISRGISSGQMYNEIARNISGWAMIPKNNAMRIARTEAHRIQTKASMNACEKAKSKGADVVKQWDSSLDKRTRDSHVRVDGEIRELNEKFSNGLMYPGDPSGGPGEVINCRCALLQRAKWALGEEELNTLKERAEFFGLDKSKNFEEYKQKYLNAAEVAAQVPKPKKEYLTEKKLKEKIADAEEELQKLKDKYGDDIGAGASVPAEDLVKFMELSTNKEEWTEKLNKKLTAKEIKKLNKEISAAKDELDAFEIKTYSGIWKDDVSTADWALKKGSIQAKKDYFENKLLYAADVDEANKWKDLIAQLDDFNNNGEKYHNIQQALKKSEQTLKKVQKNGIITQIDDKFTQERKDAAYWFTDKNGSVKGADAVLRDKSGEVWRNSSKIEKDSIYEYTRSYHKFNEPLRGIEYGTNKILGVGNVDLEQIGVNYGGYKPGEVKKQIDGLTNILEKSSYDFDIWVQRGCRRSGMDKFFGIDINDFDLPQDELAAKLIGTTPTEYAFMSTGVAKGKGLNTSGGILLNVYAPAGTKMMYVEPFSAFGAGAGKSWDGISPQHSFGHEAEMLLQRGTKFRVTKVEKSGGTIYVDVEVIEQGVY